MHIRRTASFLLTLAVATLIRATEPVGTTIKAHAEKPTFVSFSVSPTRFDADGQEHAPTIKITPTDATYSLTGTWKAKEPGRYVFTAAASGKYTGAITCHWEISQSSSGKRSSESKIYPPRHDKSPAIDPNQQGRSSAVRQP